MTVGSMTVEERAVREVLAEVGWHGASEVEVTGPDDDQRIHVRWDGRHVEALSVEAAAAYILADARAREVRTIAPYVEPDSPAPAGPYCREEDRFG